MMNVKDTITRVVYELLATRRGRQRLRQNFVEMVSDHRLSLSERKHASAAIQRLNEMDKAGVKGSA